MCYRFLASFLILVAGSWARILAQDPVPTPQTFTAQGISIEFSATTAGAGAAPIIAGQEVNVSFRINGSNDGVPLSKLHPVAWLDKRQAKQPIDARECREKVQSFLQPSFSSRPTLDLNSYFVLALNDEPNISVIDPLTGFGGSKLYTLIALKSPGEDWSITADNKRLYVSMPQINQVAVVDLPSWKVMKNLDAGTRPTRVALQHDQRYLWIGNNGDSVASSGVTVIDTVTNQTVAQIRTGPGHHEIAFSEDDRFAFVTNRDAGTVSIIDIRNLKLEKELKVGSQPSSIAFSSLSQTAYVANEGDGMLSAIQASTRELVAQMKTAPGLNMVRIPDFDHYGFALNSKQNLVYAFDLSSHRIVRTIPVGPGSDQLTYTTQFVYVRATGSEFVTMIKLSDIANEAPVTRFPAGQRSPNESSSRSVAAAIVPAPEDGAVLVANPADQTIYYYNEGMAAPMGSFQNYKRDPRALLVVDNSLREVRSGFYTTTARFESAGEYDVVFMLDSPRLINCFKLKVSEDPGSATAVEAAVKIEPLVKQAVARVGERFVLRFKLIDTRTGTEQKDLKDLSVLVFLAPGIWQQNDLAKSIGDGIYEMSFVPPSAGVYYVFFQSASLRLQYNQSTPLTIQSVEP